MKELVEKYVGAKVAALLAGLATLWSSVYSYTQGNPRAGDVIAGLQAMMEQLDITGLLPAPLVAALVYFARRAISDDPDDSHNNDKIEATTPDVPTELDPSQLDEIITDDEEPKLTPNDITIKTPPKSTANDHTTNDGSSDPLSDLGLGGVSSVRRDHEKIGTIIDKRREIEKELARLATLEDEILAKEKKNRKEKAERARAQLTEILQGGDATPEDLLGELVPDMKIPINERNNNPLNIRPTREGGNRWVGEIDTYNGYARFKTMAYGIRAALYLLRRSYFNRHKLRTVHDIIHRWAPLGDNSDESVTNYIAFVAKRLGVEPTAELRLDVSDEQLIEMAIAMATFEGGRKPDIGDHEWERGLVLLEKASTIPV